MESKNLSKRMASFVLFSILQAVLCLEVRLVGVSMTALTCRSRVQVWIWDTPLFLRRKILWDWVPAEILSLPCLRVGTDFTAEGGRVKLMVLRKKICSFFRRRVILNSKDNVEIPVGASFHALLRKACPWTGIHSSWDITLIFGFFWHGFCGSGRHSEWSVLRCRQRRWW